MAKKKVEKEIARGTGPTVTPIDNALEINQIINEVKSLKHEGIKTNERIDRIVDAIARSRKVKGL